ncbi:MAG: lasso RiPP family leader peptide-containing protein [Solirubrobacteraceae bacterium]
MNSNDKPEDARGGADESAMFQYEQPRVTDLGSIRDLTKSGTNVGSDGLSGAGGGGGS